MEEGERPELKVRGISSLISILSEEPSEELWFSNRMINPRRTNRGGRTELSFERLRRGKGRRAEKERVVEGA